MSTFTEFLAAVTWLPGISDGGDGALDAIKKILLAEQADSSKQYGARMRRVQLSTAADNSASGEYPIVQYGEVLLAVEFPHSDEKLDCTLAVDGQAVDTYTSSGGAHNSIQFSALNADFPIAGFPGYGRTLTVPNYTQAVNMITGVLNDSLRAQLSTFGAVSDGSDTPAGLTLNAYTKGVGWVAPPRDAAIAASAIA